MNLRFLKSLPFIGSALATFAMTTFNTTAIDFIKIEAGTNDYPATVVEAELTEAAPESGFLRARSGKSIPFQRSGKRMIVFSTPALKPGEEQVFQVDASKSAPGQSTIEAIEENGKISIRQSGKKLFTYQGDESGLPRPDIKPIYKRGGYIHPLLSPSGKLLTDDYPRNHLHHHGIWFPWTKTTFEGRSVDFWNMGDGKGKVAPYGIATTWSGPVQAGFEAAHLFVDLTVEPSKTVLNETWKVTAYNIPGVKYYMFDLVSTQTCATAEALQLPKYYYGGLGFRGNWDWNGERNCEFLTANGETNRVKGNETRANWCHIGGMVDGIRTGVTIMCHPDNFRALQPMRLHPSEPFFCYAPSQLGDWSIKPGHPYVSRYRFIVQDGAPDKAELDRLWTAYAHPPKVTVASGD